MKKGIRELRAMRATAVDAAEALVNAAEAEDRDFNEQEQTDWDAHIEEARAIDRRIQRLQDTGALVATLESRTPPAHNRIQRGEDEDGMRGYMHYLRTGDASGMEDAPGELRASNDTDMNVGTGADGGNAVPTGHHQEIIARRDEMALEATLGVRPIPGVGTTVNVPFDNEADGEFVTAAEAGAYDRDAPAIGQKAMTLVKYTKKVEMSVELLQDEDSRLAAFLTDFVGRGMAKTDNNLLLVEVAANGTSFKTFASATAIAAGEPEDIAFNDALDPYLDDSISVGWVTRRSTFGDIASITANARLYAEAPGGARGGELLGYPVKSSVKAAAVAASAKSIYFGNWNYVGVREAPSMGVLRDPYTLGHLGQVRLLYMYRKVYGVLVAEAVGYGEHPTG